MKIAFDLRRIGNPGIGRYMRGLAESVIASAPHNEYLLILPYGFQDRFCADARSVRRTATRAKSYSIREQVEIPRLLLREKVDLLHSPHFNVPLLRPCRLVVTIHDVIYLACPQDLPSLTGRLYYRAMISAAARLADRVITVSEFSKNEIARKLNIPLEKIGVIDPGVDANFQPASVERIRSVQLQYGITGDYILYTGIFKSRKNHAGLIRAFRHFVDSGASAQLVIAGPLDGSITELQRLANELGLSDRVVFTGFVSEANLPALYSGARVYACPSLYEGFGFTVLEAMACGVPVVCSPLTSLPEVAGDAALYADPASARKFGGALVQAFTDSSLRAGLVERGFKNVKRFRWNSTAARVLEVYGSVLKQPVAGAAFA
ncbi:MAG TPA: glycosyltransferase family 1 protein [Terriglobales bacterium]|nr:glycosyltransferase family 1 protein [Terriglobales bacterium]